MSAAVRPLRGEAVPRGGGCPGGRGCLSGEKFVRNAESWIMPFVQSGRNAAFFVVVVVDFVCDIKSQTHNCDITLMRSVITVGDSLEDTLFDNLNFDIAPSPITCSSMIHKTRLHSSGRLLVIAPVVLVREGGSSVQTMSNEPLKYVNCSFTTSQKCWKYICQKTNAKHNCWTSALLNERLPEPSLGTY